MTRRVELPVPVVTNAERVAEEYDHTRLGEAVRRMCRAHDDYDPALGTLESADGVPAPDEVF